METRSDLTIEVPGAAPNGKDAIKTEVIDDHILLIRIDRPHRRNAFDGATARAMESVINNYEADHNLHCAIITGSDTVFSSGQDLAAVPYKDFGTSEKRGGFGIMKVPPTKPVIAAVEGMALGGGLELCLSCDLVVASRTAQMGLPEVARSLLALGGGLFRLAKRIPYHIAMEMILTGQHYSAEYMKEIGLVNQLAEPGRAAERAIELAHKIIKNAPLAVQASKLIVQKSVDWTDEESWEKQEGYAGPVLSSQDFHEGLRAFAEKRKPEWKGG